MNMGDYDDAIVKFDSVGAYKDAKTKAMENRYQKSKALLAAGDYDKASEMLFNLRNSTSNEIERFKQIAYNDGLIALADEHYCDAFYLFLFSLDYSDSFTKCSSIADLSDTSEVYSMLLNVKNFIQKESNDDGQNRYVELAQTLTGHYLKGSWITSMHKVANDYQFVDKEPSNVTISFIGNSIQINCPSGFDVSYSPKRVYSVNISDLNMSGNNTVSGKFSDGPITSTQTMHGKISIDLSENTISLSATRGRSTKSGDSGNFMMELVRE